MAAQQTHRIVLECSDQRAGMVAFELVERRNQSKRVFGQLERRRVGIQFADTRQSKTEKLTYGRRGAQQRGEPPTSSHVMRSERRKTCQRGPLNGTMQRGGPIHRPG